jgi:ubiquinone/menaquinone biosynthesis C-methylase UbiE
VLEPQDLASPAVVAGRQARVHLVEMSVPESAALHEIAAAGRANTPDEWTAYFHAFHEALPNANDLFTILKTRSNDTSYTIVAKAVSSTAREVLDLACGDGNLIEELLAHVSRTALIHGVDISSAETRIAERRFHDEPRVEIRTGDAAALPYADASFDCVIAHQFLNFLPDIHPYLNEIARVLRPGARLLFVANRGWQHDRDATWIKINDAALAAIRDLYPKFVWPKMGDMRMYDEEGIHAIFSESRRFDMNTISIGSFTSSALMTPDRVAAVYNRLYLYGLIPEKKRILEAVTARAQELATRGDLVELSLPFRLVTVRTRPLSP